jgi:Tol biopolymer transport system component
MSQLVSQHLRESLDLGKTVEADEGIDRIRSRTRPSELDVPGAGPDDRDVAETRGVDALDMEHSDSPRRHLERRDHLDVKDVSEPAHSQSLCSVGERGSPDELDALTTCSMSRQTRTCPFDKRSRAKPVPASPARAGSRAPATPTVTMTQNALVTHVLVTHVPIYIGDFLRTAHGFGYAFCGEARDTTDEEPRQSLVALDRKADPNSPAVELLPVPDSDPPRRFSFRRPWVWLAAAVLAAAGLSAVRSRWASPDAAPPKAVPLTSLQGIVRFPSLSPDGTYVVFSWNGPRGTTRTSVQQIGVTAPPHRLTSDPANDYSPSWSPDGRTIAFLRRGPDGGKNEVLRIAPLGGPERRVAETQPRLPSFIPASLAWCPDSTCLVVTDTLGADKADALFQISLETSERRQLTHPQGIVGDAGPVLSPDGGVLVFRRSSNPGGDEFYRISLKDGKDSEGDPVRLTSTSSPPRILYAGKPVWIPDSPEILFSAKGGLWRLDVLTGGTPSRLPFVGQDGTAVAVARVPGGGRRLVYARSFADTNVWRIDTARPGARAASPPAAAIAATRQDVCPNLTSDGRRVVFVSDRSGEFEFWVADPDGSIACRATRVPSATGPVATPGCGTSISPRRSPLRWLTTLARSPGASARPATVGRYSSHVSTRRSTS